MASDKNFLNVTQARARITDSVAHQLEVKGFWLRAADRWLRVMDYVHGDLDREAVTVLRNNCIKMAKDSRAVTR